MGPLFPVQDIFLLNDQNGIKLIEILTLAQRLADLCLIAQGRLVIVTLRFGNPVFLILIPYDRNFEKFIKGRVQIHIFIVGRSAFL